MERYPQELREYVVERMLGPDQASAYCVAQETGLASTTVARWRDRARSVARMTDKPVAHDPGPDTTPPASPPPSRRPQDWTPEERLAAVVAAEGLSDEKLGAWMRQRGLHGAVLAEWRGAAVRGLGGKAAAAADGKRIKELERDLHRKDKALAETAALLVLAGKARALWGDEGGSMGSK